MWCLPVLTSSLPFSPNGLSLPPQGHSAWQDHLGSEGGGFGCRWKVGHLLVSVSDLYLRYHVPYPQSPSSPFYLDVQELEVSLREHPKQTSPLIHLFTE